MAYFTSVLIPIIQIFIIAAIGYFLYLKQFLDEKATLQLSNLLTWIVAPLLLFTRFQMDYSAEKFIHFVTTFVLALILMTIGIFISHIFFKKSKPIALFGAAFPNSGFIGIPLVTSVLGSEYIFELSAYLVSFNLLLYSYGIYLYTRKNQAIDWHKLLYNPGIIAILCGVLLFISPLKLPFPVFLALESIGDMTVPVAMLLLGTYLAKVNIFKAFADPGIYYFCFVKLIVIPVITLLLLKFLPIPSAIKIVLLIATCAPAAVATGMMAQIYDQDFSLAGSYVGISSIFSIITIPLLITTAQIIL